MNGLAGSFHPERPPDVRSIGAMLRRMDSRGTGARLDRPVAGGAIGVTVPPGWSATDGLGASRDGRWVVALGARPLNARTLGDELRARGRVRDGAGMAELAAEVIAEIGFDRGISRLDGAVPVVAVDVLNRRVFLARDRVGVHPLHYAIAAEGTLWWASDLAALEGCPGLDRTLSRSGIASLLVLGVAPAPLTVWEGVRKLGAGELVEVAGGVGTVRRHWESAPHPPGREGSWAPWVKSLSYAIDLAVRHHVPEASAVAHGGGAFSGGVAEQMGRRGAAGVHVAIGGVGALSLDDPTALLADVSAGPEPVAAPQALAWLRLAQTAWESGATTLATGLGGPETFGFDRRPLVARVRDRVRGGDPTDLTAVLFPQVESGDRDAPIWAGVERWRRCDPAQDPAAWALWVRRNLHLPEGPLAMAERACASHGMALAAPLADPALVTLACSVPVEHHRASGPRALFVAAAVTGSAPPPAPMVVPVTRWLSGPCDRLLDGLPETLGTVVHPDRLRWEVAAFRQGGHERATRLWAALALDQWLRRHA